MQISNFSFAHPWLLLSLLLVPLLAYWYYKRILPTSLKIPLPGFDNAKIKQSWRSYGVKVLPILSLAGLSALCVALARPQLSLQEEVVKADGVDIMLVMDLSSSMLAQDFNPNRLEAAKELAQEFVDKRPYDRLGLVVFSGEAFTQCPLTVDHKIVKEFLNSLQCGLLEDGTAIGMGLATAVNRIKDSESKSKIVILLTDGSNNKGYIKPMTAAEIAKETKVKVYAIGVGTEGMARAPVSRTASGQFVYGTVRVEIDEQLLTEMCDITGGKYFRATNIEQLRRIYDYIDQLEKTEIEVNVFKKYEEKYRPFAIAGLLLLCVSWLLGHSIFRTLP